MTKFLPFYYDTKGFYQNDKSFMIVGECLEYLTGFLNSSLFKFCFLESFPELQGGTRELRKIFFDKIRVKKIDNETNQVFVKLIHNLQDKINNKQETNDLELKIDNLIFDIYELSIEERLAIGFIKIL